MFDPSGKEEFINEIVIPELPIQKNIYFCDKKFRIEFMEQYLEKIEEVLVIMVFGEETLYYNLAGTHYNLIRKFGLHRQKAQKKGGQSAPRFQRIRLNQINEYINKIHEELFEIQKNRNYQKIIVCGNAEIKDKIIDKNIIDTLTIDSDNLIEHLPKIQSIISSKNNKKEDKIINELIDRITLLDETIVYGKKEVDEQLEFCKEIYISNSLKQEYANFTGKINIIDHYKLEIYGNILGIKYY